MMPNKTIYVAEDDLPLYERAQALTGGNLSSAVARALRRYVEVEEAQGRGFDEVSVRVGPAGSQRRKRFFGVRLVRWQHVLAGSRTVEVFAVYRTQGGRYAVHRQVQPDWDGMADPHWWFDVENWKGLNPRKGNLADDGRRAGEASLDVYDTLAELEPHVPPELFLELRRDGDAPPIEDLDI